MVPPVTRNRFRPSCQPETRTRVDGKLTQISYYFASSVVLGDLRRRRDLRLAPGPVNVTFRHGMNRCPVFWPSSKYNWTANTVTNQQTSTWRVALDVHPCSKNKAYIMSAALCCQSLPPTPNNASLPIFSPSTTPPP